jgi:hypothetical protein
MPGKCLLVSVYIVPVILLSIALVLEGLKYWWKSNLAPNAKKPSGETSVLDESKTKRLNVMLGKTAERYYVVPSGESRFDREKREFVVPVGVLVAVHAAGIAMMYLAEYMVWFLFNFRMGIHLFVFRRWLWCLYRWSLFHGASRMCVELLEMRNGWKRNERYCIVSLLRNLDSVSVQSHH